MSKKTTKYSIFIASPSDLEEERNAIEDVIKELNLTFGNQNNIVIELLKWETHSAPGISNSHPQELINKDIGDEYDLFLGLLWTKFGTPTRKADSGTEEEYQRAINRFKANNKDLQILFYFKSTTPKSLKEIDANELLKIEKFKNSISKDKLLYWEFDTCEKLKKDLRQHIPLRINTLINNKLKQNTNTNLVKISDEDSNYGLLDYIEIFEDLMKKSTISLQKISKDIEWIGKNISSKNEELQKIHKLPNDNNHTLTGILKRTAKSLNDYTNRLEHESPIFHTNFKEGIESGIKLINLIDDFNSANTISGLNTSKTSILNLRTSISEALIGVNSFYESIKALPRIQKDINTAKKRLLIQVEGLINKLNNSLELTEDFSNKIGNKMDKLKVLNQLK